MPAGENGEYFGMPMLQAVGPIVMDPEVQKRVDSLSQQNPAIVGKVALDEVKHPNVMQMAVWGARQAVIRIHNDHISLVSASDKADESSQLIEPDCLLEINFESDLKVEIVRKVQETLIISSDEGAFSVKVNFQDNKARDVATLLIRQRQLEFSISDVPH